MTLTRRAVAVPLVALIVFAQLVFLAVPGYALDPTRVAPRAAAGIGLRWGAGVAGGPITTALIIGWTAWEGYNFLVDGGYLDGGTEASYAGQVGYSVYGEPGTTGSRFREVWYQMSPDGTEFFVYGYNNHCSQYGESQVRLQEMAVVPEGSNKYGWNTTGECYSHYFEEVVPLSFPPTRTLLTYNGLTHNSVSADFVVQGTGESLGVYYEPTAEGMTTQWFPRTEAECIDGTGLSEIVTEAGPVGGADQGNWQAPEVLCPPDTQLGRVTVTLEPSGGTGSSHEVMNWEANPDYLPGTALYPGCLPGGAEFPCELHVTRPLIISDPGGEWVRCDEFTGNCYNWWTHNMRDDLFRCMWGLHQLHATECQELAYYYNTGTETQGLLTPNPNLKPPTTTTTVPTEVPFPGGPPASPGLLTPPTLAPPTTETPPTTGQPPVDQPATADGCLATELVAFNPVTWVYAPVKCVFIWAFVPTQTQTQWAQLRTEAETRPPFVATTTAIPFVRGAVAGWGGACPSALAVFWNHEASIRHGFSLDAEIPCDPDIDGMALVRAVQTFAVVAAGAFAMWRIYSSAVET